VKRAVRALLAVVAAGLVLPLAGAPAAARSAPAPAAALDVLQQTPYVAEEGSFLLALSVRDAPPGSHIETVLYRDAIADRATFNKTLFGVDLGENKVSLPKIEVDDQALTGTRRRQADIGISLVQQQPDGEGRISLERGLTEGVHPIDIRLFGPDGRQLDRIITYLVRLPEDVSQVQPLKAAMVFDVHAPPSVDPLGRTALHDQDLDQIGALTQALRAHPDSRVTLVPTPETIEALAREPGRPQALLERLQATLPHSQVIDQPYVDVPVSSWIAAGMQGELNQQRERGNAVVTDHLKRPDRTTWIGTSDLTSEAAAELWEGGVTRFVLPEPSFSPSPGEDGESGTARPFELATRVDAPVQAVALDGSLTHQFLRDDIDDPELQSLQLVAELSVIQGAEPDEARGVVFGSIDGTPFSSRVVSDTLDLLRDNPLVRTASVGEVFDDVAPARTGTDGPVVKRTLTPTPSPDLGDYPDLLREVQAHITSYEQVTSQSRREAASWQQRLLVSGARELSPAERNRYLDVIQATIADRVARIKSPARQTVTLTSREGAIPFTLLNGLTRPVNVMVELDGGPRVEFPGGETRTALEVEPGVHQIKMRVSTRGPGVVPVTVRVMSPDQGLLIATSKVTVRSTAVSGIGYVLTIGAAGFLVIWWFQHWRRTRRERQAALSTPAGPTDRAT
jgi:hypothetical protein